MGEQKRIKFLFQKAPDYKLFPANGAWGGATTRGDFILEFFVEHNTTPNYVMHEITTEGKLDKESKKDPEEPGVILVTRELVGGVSLSIEHAKSIASFIQEKCADIEKERKQDKRDESEKGEESG